MRISIFFFVFLTCSLFSQAQKTPSYFENRNPWVNIDGNHSFPDQIIPIPQKIKILPSTPESVTPASTTRDFVYWDGKSIVAITRSNFINRWLYRTKQNEIINSILICGNKVIFTNKDGVTRSVDLETGKENWSISLNTEILGDNVYGWPLIITPPIVIGEKLLIGTSHSSFRKGPFGELHVLNVTNGNLISTIEIDDWFMTPIYVTDTALLMGGFRSFLSFDRNDLHPLWKVNIRKYGQMRNLISIQNNNAYFPTGFTSPNGQSWASGDLSCIDIITGKIKWKYTELGAANIPILGINGTIIINKTKGFGSNILMALNQIDGTKINEYSASTDYSAVITKNLIFMVDNDNKLICMNPINGEKKFNLPLNGKCMSAPLIIENSIITLSWVGGSQGAVVQAHSINDGTLLWELTHSFKPTTELSFSEGVIYFKDKKDNLCIVNI